MNDQGPSGLQEALKRVIKNVLFTLGITRSCFSCSKFLLLSPTQVKHYRALQEQASTYLDLVCSVCDLSDDAVRIAAAQVQQIKIMVSHFPAYSLQKRNLKFR